MSLRDANGKQLTGEQVANWAPRGWRPLVSQLIDDLFALGWDGEVHQVKEKFGGLRFYVGAAGVEISDRIALAEALSYTTCEACGDPGALVCPRGWYYTLCSPHAEVVAAGTPVWKLEE